MYLSKTEAAVLPTTLVGTPKTPTPTPAGRRRIWPLLGPAFVAAVAYVDPGNVATNVEAGSRFGYRLLSAVGPRRQNRRPSARPPTRRRSRSAPAWR